MESIRNALSMSTTDEEKSLAHINVLMKYISHMSCYEAKVSINTIIPIILFILNASTCALSLGSKSPKIHGSKIKIKNKIHRGKTKTNLKILVAGATTTKRAAN